MSARAKCTSKANSKTEIVILVAAIVVALIVVGVLLMRQGEVTQTLQEQATVSQETYPENDEDYVVDEEALDDEIAVFMNALGIDNADLPGGTKGYTKEEIAVLETQNYDRHAPPVGDYHAIRLFEGGVEKDLAALRATGRELTAHVGEDKTFTSDFLGIDITGTYDDKVIHIEHMNDMPIFWDEDTQVLTIFSHQLQVEFAPDVVITPSQTPVLSDTINTIPNDTISTVNATTQTANTVTEYTNEEM